MSSSYCLGKSRDSRRERLSLSRATVPILSNGNHEREKNHLFDAVNAQDYDRVLDLLQSNFSPRIADKYGRTPLHIASTKLDAGIVKSLIDHGADVNAEDSLGNTPLHLACISSRLPIVGVLLRAGAILPSTKCPTTPLAVALRRLQTIMNEKLTLSSPELKTEIIEVIHLLKKRPEQAKDDKSISDLCEQLENLNSSLSNDSILDPSIIMTDNRRESTKKTLFLVRHGQSLANRDYDESSAYRDAGLTEHGIAQAQGLRRELEKLDIELAVVSPLTRALQTCQNALPPSYKGPIIVLPEITEICSSYYSCGQKRRVVEPNFPSSFDWSNIGMDDVWWWQFERNNRSENVAHKNERFEKFRQFIKQRPEQRIVVFSHGDYIWEFLEGKHPYPANCQVATYKF